MQDPDADGGIERLTLSVAHGALALPLSTGLTSSSGDGTGSVQVEGTITALDEALEGLLYTPSANFHGSDSLEVQADDQGHTGAGGAKTSSGSVALTVTTVTYDKALPDSYTGRENETLEVSAPGVLGNDTDSDTPPLPLEVKEVTTPPQHGTVTLQPDGALSYTPDNGFHGRDSFEYDDTDGNSSSNQALVSIEVEEVDQAPVNTVPAAQTVEENATLSFSSLGANGISVEDVDADGGVEQVTLSAGHGVLTPGPTGSLASVSGSGTATLVLQGTIPALDEALENLTYAPAHNYHAADALKLETDDLGHTGAGGPLTSTSEVPITVTSVVYDEAVSDSYTVAQDGTLEVSAPGVLANDTDSDLPPLPLQAEEVTARPQHGAVTLESNGSFIYTPDHLYTGTDSFKYIDSDGNTPSNEATVTIDVEAQTFDSAVNDSYAVHENGTLSVGEAAGVLANDTDSAGLPLEARPASSPAHGTVTLNANGSFTYVPDVNFSGTDSFTYKDDDGNTESNEATVTIVVEHVDHAPVNTVPGAQTAESGVPLTFSSLDSNAISVQDVDADGGIERVTLSAEHGALAPNLTGTLSKSTGTGTKMLVLEGTTTALNEALEGLAYTAESHYTGQDTLTIETDDLGHTGLEGPKTTSSTVAITVLHVNEPPTLSLPGPQEVDESTSSTPADLVFAAGEKDAITVGDPDADGGVEQVRLSAEHGIAKLGGDTSGLTSQTGNESASVTIEGTIAALNEALEGLKYQPASEYSGSARLGVEINDNGHTGTGGAKTANGDVAITVRTPAPVPTNPTYRGAIGNTNLYVGVSKGTAPGVEQSGSVLPSPATEANGSTLTIKPETIPTKQHGSVAMNENGSFTYTPPVSFENGTDTFEYTEKNSRGGEATGTATIEVDNARVWYVNDSASSNGDGESGSPFNTLSSVSGSSSKAGSGDEIFLYGGGPGYGGGIELKASQTLSGQDEGLTVEGETLIGASGSNPTITNSSGAGIKLAEGDTIKGVTVSGTSGAGIAASGVNEFTLNSKVKVEGTSGDGLEVTGGDGTIKDEAAIKVSGASSHSLLVSGRTGGTVTVAGTIEDIGDGISLSNDAGSIAFSGKLALSTGEREAFMANDAGTITASSGESTITTTTATALDVEGTTIGAAGLKFKSISAGTASAGPSHGIVLEKTGSSGGLDVTGSGSAGSGGTVQHTTGSGGIYLDETDDDSLSDMDVTHSSSNGIYGTQVSNLSVAGSSLANNEDGLLVEATGSQEVSVKATAGDSFAENKEQGFETVQKSSGAMHVTVEKDSFTKNIGTGVDITSESGGFVEFGVTGNKLTDQQGNAINVFVDGSGKTEGEVLENEVGVKGEANSGSVAGDGIEIDAGKSETFTTNVSKNKVFEIENEHGIEAHAGEGSATLNITLEKNDVNTEETSSLDGIFVDSGVYTTDTSIVCMNAVENTSHSAGNEAGNLTRETYGLVLVQQTASSVFEIQGYKGSGTSNAEVDNFLASKNTLSAGGGAAEVEFYKGFTSAEKCPTVP